MATRGTKRRRVGKSSAFRIAKAALSGVKKLRGERETKFHGETIASLNIPLVTSSITAHYLSDVDQGDGPGTRDGSDIKPTSLFFRYAVRRAIGSANEFDYVRIVVIKDEFTNGVAPQWSSVFNSASVFAPMNRGNAARFKVMYDKLIVVSDTTRAVTRKKYMRLSGTTSYFLSGNGTADVNKNSYWFFRATKSTGSFPVLDLDARINYKDP